MDFIKPVNMNTARPAPKLGYTYSRLIRLKIRLRSYPYLTGFASLFSSLLHLL